MKRRSWVFPNHMARMTKLMEVFENIETTVHTSTALERTDRRPKVYSDGRGGLMQFS